MSGGAYDYTAAYVISTNNVNLTNFGSSLVNGANYTKDVYTSSVNTGSGNYDAAASKYGDAVYEDVVERITVCSRGMETSRNSLNWLVRSLFVDTVTMRLFPGIFSFFSTSGTADPFMSASVRYSWYFKVALTVLDN